MKIRMLAAVSVIALALPMTALAGPKGGKGGGHGEMLSKLDTNADGAVSKDEVNAHRAAKFAEVDADKDGKISKAEADAQHASMKAAKGEGKAQGRGKRSNEEGAAQGGGHEQMFARLDTDSDGFVTLAEFNAKPLPGFDRMDTNADGALSKEEIDAAKAKMKEKRGGKGKGKGKDKAKKPSDDGADEE